MKNKYIIAILAICIAALAFVGVHAAQAHNQAFKADCDQFKISLNSYQTNGDSFSNVAEVTLDGVYKGAYPFNEGWTQTFMWETEADTHTWLVTVDAYNTDNPYHEGPFAGTFVGECVHIPEDTVPQEPEPIDTTVTTFPSIVFDVEAAGDCEGLSWKVVAQGEVDYVAIVDPVRDGPNTRMTSGTYDGGGTGSISGMDLLRETWQWSVTAGGITVTGEVGPCVGPLPETPSPGPEETTTTTTVPASTTTLAVGTAPVVTTTTASGVLSAAPVVTSDNTPETTTLQRSGVLPVTGSSVMSIVFLAVLVVAAGALLVLTVRRVRSHG